MCSYLNITFNNVNCCTEEIKSLTQKEMIRPFYCENVKYFMETSNDF